ncbi:MAG: Cullin-3 [Bathelium mastoideum]|nr:MAG: Cullin-3 [Bathelium mastoideum]
MKTQADKEYWTSKYLSDDKSGSTPAPGGGVALPSLAALYASLFDFAEHTASRPTRALKFLRCTRSPLYLRYLVRSNSPNLHFVYKPVNEARAEPGNFRPPSSSRCLIKFDDAGEGPGEDTSPATRTTFLPQKSVVATNNANVFYLTIQGINGDDLDFEATWAVLAASFREIHTKNASKLSFEELYRNAYKIVLRKRGESLYDKVKDFEQAWLSNEVRQRLETLLSTNLVSRAEGEIAGSTASERTFAGEKFLKGLRDAWVDHQTCMSMLTDVLMYMIQMDRAGDIIDKYLIKSCVYMLEALYDTPAENEDEKLYITSFELDFLEASRAFYKKEGERLLRESDAGTYCKHVRRRIGEEQDRCRSTLSESTQPKIEVIVLDELVRNKIKDVIEMDSGVKFMVDNDRIEELGLVFDLNQRVDDRKAELSRAIQKRVIDIGTDVNTAAVVASQAQAGKDSETKDENKDEPSSDKGRLGAERAVNQQTVAALKWVEDVLALKDKFDRIHRDSFALDQTLQTAITRSISEFINAFSRSSEYISLFIDENMKKGLKGKTEQEVDVVLEKAITLLRYIQDKDMFERYYKKHLCRRLLMAKSVSTDVEKQMISRMKIELGNNFTSKLEAMFKDMQLSEDLTSGYRHYVQRLGDPDPKRIDLDMKVLTSMTWPLESIGGGAGGEDVQQRSRCTYPPILERIKKGFEQYYADKHSGRVLTWHANLGSADLRATFPKVSGAKEGTSLGKERRHEINVSTFAMVILLLFNDLVPNQTLTTEEIQAKTNIPMSELCRNLQSLAVAPKTRLLTKEPMSKDIKMTDRFSFNESFQSKFLKLKVGVVSQGNKVEGDRERQETEKKNNDSRGFNIEAAVVRIMKQRKELTHQQLITETLTQLAAQFKPDVNMIKKRIESLIEREYLERMDDAATPSYRYLA